MRIGMVRTIGKLTTLKINRLSQPGMYADGGGLYLQVNGATGGGLSNV